MREAGTTNEKVIAFHIDMNVGQFSRAHLERWLRYLAGVGYNTIIWEVENNVSWNTCPECVSPDAFSKDEFRAILHYAESLGLTAVPLFQTIGHAEYVLRHDRYRHLRELPERIDQYCPLHPELLPFLQRWIEEYLELFGEVESFHLGADEAWNLGACPKCSAFSERQSRSRLYIDHINAVSEPLRKRGITPIIWGDMALKYPDAIAELSRDITIFDWMYDIDLHCPTVWVWGRGMVAPGEIDDATRERFGKFIFPDQSGGSFNIFYTTDYLQSEGFTTITCPSSSSFGDNVFTPLESKHQPNTWDFGGKGLRDAAGTLLTSWSVHLHTWEVQKTCIDMVAYRAANPDADVDGFRADFERATFGVAAPEFFEACSHLETRSPWTYTRSLGVDKSCPEVPSDFVLHAIEEMKRDAGLDAALEQARNGLREYRLGHELIRGVQGRARQGQDYLAWWLLASEVLMHRARSAIYLLTAAQGGKAEGDRQTLISELETLAQRMTQAYEAVHRPTRRELMMRWMFESVGEALRRS